MFVQKKEKNVHDTSLTFKNVYVVLYKIFQINKCEWKYKVSKRKLQIS